MTDTKDTVQFARSSRRKTVQIETLTVIRLTDDGYFSHALGTDSEYIVQAVPGAPGDEARVGGGTHFLDLDDMRIEIDGDYEIASPDEVPAEVVAAISKWSTKSAPVTRV